MDHTVRLWCVATGRELLKIEMEGPVHGVALSPDGRRVAATGGPLCVYDVTDGKRIAVCKGYKGSLFKVAFSPDGRTLASGGKDGVVYLWRAAGGDPIHGLKGHGKEVLGVAFAPDGRTLFSASWDRTVRMWDPVRGETIRTLESKFMLQCLAVSPDGRQVAGGDVCGWIRIWETAGGRELRSLSLGSEMGIGCLVFFPDGSRLASGRAGALFELWDPSTGKRVRRFGSTRENLALSLAFSPDGRRMYGSTQYGTVLVYDVTRHMKKGSGPPAEPAALWAAVGGADDIQAYAAMRRLAAQGDAVVAFLEERLAEPPDAEKAAAIGKLIGDLDHDDFAVREEALEKLKAQGAAAEPHLQKALAGTISPDARARIKGLLAELGKGPLLLSGEAQWRERACLILEWIGTDGAKALLEKAAAAAPTGREQREAEAALIRLNRSTEP
jgi:hypothetical protein